MLGRMQLIYVGLTLSAFAAGTPVVPCQSIRSVIPNSPRQPQFEVVSIRPEKQNAGISYSPTADGFEATGQSLTSLILMAYLPMPLWRGDRVKNAPAWALSETYTIRAKIAQEDLAALKGSNGKELQMAMMRNLLTERFHLRVHTEPQDMKGFALVRFKESSSLRPTAPGEVLPKYIPLSQGVVQPKSSPSGRVMSFYGATMKSLAGFLTPDSRTTVEDQTGLGGSFDFDLRHLDTPGVITSSDIADPSDRWDLRSLGLKTVTRKVPSINIIVDYAEHPSAN